MRKLTPPDVFKLVRFLKDSGIKERVKPFLLKAASGTVDVEDIGFDVIMEFVSEFTTEKTEEAFYALLEGPFEMGADAIKTMDFDAFLEALEALWQDPARVRFFKLASDLLSRN